MNGLGLFILFLRRKGAGHFGLVGCGSWFRVFPQKNRNQILKILSRPRHGFDIPHINAMHWGFPQLHPY